GKPSSTTHARGWRKRCCSWLRRPNAMTDAEAAEYVARTGAFVDAFLGLLEAVGRANTNVSQQLARIATSIDAVDIIDLCNLETVNDLSGGVILDLIKARLARAADYADGTAFFAEFQPAVDKARRQRQRECERLWKRVADLVVCARRYASAIDHARRSQIVECDPGGTAASGRIKDGGA